MNIAKPLRRGRRGIIIGFKVADGWLQMSVNHDDPHRARHRCLPHFRLTAGLSGEYPAGSVDYGMLLGLFLYRMLPEVSIALPIVSAELGQRLPPGVRSAEHRDYRREKGTVQGGYFDEIAVDPINLQPGDEEILATRLREKLSR